MTGRQLWPRLPTLFTFVILFMPGDGVQCFLCSFSPRSNSSRVDGCTETSFRGELVDSRPCPLGCEAVTVYDINGELESFHRNCATTGTIMTNSCETYKTRVLTRRICSCDTSYCNAAGTQPPTTLLLAFSMAASLGLATS